MCVNHNFMERKFKVMTEQSLIWFGWKQSLGRKSLGSSLNAIRELLIINLDDVVVNVNTWTNWRLLWRFRSKTLEDLDETKQMMLKVWCKLYGNKMPQNLEQFGTIELEETLDADFDESIGCSWIFGI